MSGFANDDYSLVLGKQVRRNHSLNLSPPTRHLRNLMEPLITCRSQLVLPKNSNLPVLRLLESPHQLWRSKRLRTSRVPVLLGRHHQQPVLRWDLEQLHQVHSGILMRSPCRRVSLKHIHLLQFVGKGPVRILTLYSNTSHTINSNTLGSTELLGPANGGLKSPNRISTGMHHDYVSYEHGIMHARIFDRALSFLLQHTSKAFRFIGRILCS